MSDNIDYDELDKAVTEAIKARSSKKTTTSKAAAKPAAPKNISKAQTVPVGHKVKIPAPRPQPAHQYMDFVRRPATVTPKPVQLIPNAAVQRPATTIHRAAAPAPKPVQRLVATKATAASMPQYRTAAKPVVRAAAPTPKPVAKPVVAPKPVAKPTPKPAAQPVARPAVRVVAPAPKPVAKPAPKTAPISNADNYSIGGRSPFLTDKKVEKTPLGKNTQQSSVNSIESTKNTYSQKSPIKLKGKTEKKHIVTEGSKEKSGWLWAFIVLLVVAAGGGAGYLTYLLFFAK